MEVGSGQCVGADYPVSAGVLKTTLPITPKPRPVHGNDRTAKTLNLFNGLGGKNETAKRKLNNI